MRGVLGAAEDRGTEADEERLVGDLAHVHYTYVYTYIYIYI